jgi:hypothetical protein
MEGIQWGWKSVAMDGSWWRWKEVGDGWKEVGDDGRESVMMDGSRW